LGIPCKTAAGHAEMAAREQRLSQRHRLLLLLVDGQRTLEEVVEQGRRCGVPRGYIDELFALGLIVIGPPPTAPMPLDGPDTVSPGGVVSDTELARLDAGDGTFAQARQLLLALLRTHAPVFGAVMMLRVRRARSRAELRALLPDVQARLQRVRPQGEMREQLLRVESLLAA
jgi:hypothetical protein